MFAQSREEVRSHFLSVWGKMSSKVPLQPLEQLLARVIEQHPEYHVVFNDPARALRAEYSGDVANSNPFLHMSLHVAIAEQLQTDRPAGVVKAYNAMVEKRTYDAHAIEHKMIDCLSASLWQAQRDSRPPDEAAYISCLKRAI